MQGEQERQQTSSVPVEMEEGSPTTGRFPGLVGGWRLVGVVVVREMCEERWLPLGEGGSLKELTCAMTT